MQVNFKPRAIKEVAPAPAAPHPVRPAKKNKKGKAGGRSKFVLILGEEGSILIYMRGNVVLRRLFAPSAQPQHTDTMVELMRGHPKVPLYILADVIDQQYVRQSFPPVSSLSVKGLVNRRLDRDFQPEDMKGFLPLGRDKTGRKEWNFLLIALVKTPLLQSWLEVLLEQPNELKGIFLLPVEATRYIAMLHKAMVAEKGKEWKLLVTHNKVSGFRQVVTRDGKLVFTRVTQALDDSIAAVIAGNIEQEIISTIEYLRRLGLPDNDALEAWVVVSQDIRDVLDMSRFNFGAHQVLTPMEVAENLGLEQAALSADRFGDVVMAAAVARENKTILRLSTSYADKLRQLYQINMAVLGLGALAALALIGLAAWNVIDIFAQKAAATELLTKKTSLQLQLQELKTTVDSLNEDASFKAAVVGAAEAYVKPIPGPLDFIERLAPALDDSVRASGLEWATVAGKPEPLEIRVTMLFSPHYRTASELDAKAAALLKEMTEKMPEYDISNDPFGWSSNANSAAAKEIAIGITSEAAEMEPGQRTAVFIFRGPKANANKNTPPTNPVAP